MRQAYPSFKQTQEDRDMLLHKWEKQPERKVQISK